MYNLFALTDDPARRIVKFSLSEDIQNDLTRLFQEQENQFNQFAENTIPFDGKYKPDEGEVLVIDTYDDIDGLSGAIRNPLTISDIDPRPDVFSSIKALFTGRVLQDDSTMILIQGFDKRKILSTNGISIFHSDNVYKKVEGIGLTIDSKIIATINGNNLKFFSFHLLRQIFDLSDYYREATDSDINDFSSIPSIKVENLEALIEISDTWIRRKLSLIQQSRILETVAMNEIKAVATEFNISINTIIENGVEKIVLPEVKADLKEILRFLDEDYYKSPLSKTNFLTNSKRAV